jgi:hypothetical protein
MSARHQRRSARKRASQAVPVSNSMTGEALGRIGNLSEDGMMLITSKPLHEEYYYQVAFQLSGPRFAPRKFEVGIQCMWSAAARTAHTHWAGCRLIDISEAEAHALKEWLDQAENAD